MLTERQQRVRQLEMCDRKMFGDLVLTCQTPKALPTTPVTCREIAVWPTTKCDVKKKDCERRRASVLIDQLLADIYSNVGGGSTGYNSGTSSKSLGGYRVDEKTLQDKDINELSFLIRCLKERILREGRGTLLRQLKRRDALRRQREAHCNVITEQLRKIAAGNSDMRFTIEPEPGESGYSQWAAAMKMVAQLPGGIPPEFRRRLWLQLAERFLASKGIDWARVERSCFSEWSHPADAELGVQIVKDLHRTGCSLFCGEDGQENQALLKRVLLAYARWNKAVGYCQGFNMLAALILQVTERNESDALKLMIYLIEGVLPESYFADNLRGLSVDMAVFRELLKSRLPRLSKHLDELQTAAKDGSTSYEPPLTNVFTMQWFLTLFCNCLPQPTVLRVWDLILLEGNEILLRTALAIWQALADRIQHVRSADEFYCIMGVLTRELLEFGLVEPNSLIKSVVTIGPLPELKTLRDHYLYNINPWGTPLSSTSYNTDDKQLKLYPKERLVLDISALKKQYAKLKQRQRQAHIIFSAAVSRQPPRTTPVAMNHLLLGKSALMPTRRLGPPKGAIPPVRQPARTLQWKDTERPPSSSSSSSSSDTELCDEPGASSPSGDEGNGQLPNDNLDGTVGDTSNIGLMNTDNTAVVLENSASVSVTDKTDLDSKDFDSSNNQNVSDIFDTASTSDIQNLDYGLAERTDEEEFNFEKFLEERVRCLKQNSLTSEEQIDDETQENTIISGRKNSQRAFDIIQENSLILHRILQCQSRLTPSPPVEESHSDSLLHEDADRKNVFSTNSELYENCLSPTNVDCCSKMDRTETDDIQSAFNQEEYATFTALYSAKDPENFSASETDKATTEYTPGVNLLSDNCLDVNLPHVDLELGCKENRSSLDLKVNGAAVIAIDKVQESTTDSAESDTERCGSKYSSILEYSKNLNERYNTLIVNSPLSNIYKSTSWEGDFRGNSDAQSTSNAGEEDDPCRTASEVKSPVRAYNPFPVKLNSRQNKDVAVRLGLYKK